MSNPNQTPPSPYAAERAALLKASPKLQAVGGLHTPASLAQLQRVFADLMALAGFAVSYTTQALLAAEHGF